MHFAIVVASLLIAVVQPRDPKARVHDFARLLSASERETLEAVARDVERETTAQIAVVTVPSLRGQTVDDYAQELFNEWGIGRKETNNGVLLLVAPTERRMRIEVGYGLEPLLTDSLCGEIRDEQIVPSFKAGDFPAGIIAGTKRLASILQRDPQAARGDPHSGPLLGRTMRDDALMATSVVGVAALGLFILGLLAAARRLYSSTTFFATTAMIIAFVGVAAYATLRAPAREQPIGWFGGATVASLAAWCLNFVRYRRFGPHGCSKCGTHLELLSEQDDDPKLEPVQRLEEKIGSVDYDVWICPACLNQDTDRYLKSFSGFHDCPICNGRTYKEGPQKVMRRATTSSSGTARVEGRCVSCNHKSVRNILLPMIQQSSSSGSTGGSFGGGGGGGGGSFGGGSSGGGGAREVGDVYLTLAAVILCATIVVWYLLTFNSLVAARNAVDQSWSHIEVELQRRLDLIGNLVEVVKGYAKHESDTFKQVAALRTQSRPFADAAAANSVEPQLHRSIGQIMVLAESYPQLLADQSFLNLQQQLSDTENRIAERRHAYNQTVNSYQNWVLSVPSNLVARLHQLEPRSFFDAPDAAVEQPPVVRIS